MKEFTIGIIMMVKIAMAYALALIGTVLSIPAKLVLAIGAGCCKLADKIINETHVDGKQIMNEIIDMDV